MLVQCTEAAGTIEQGAEKRERVAKFNAELQTGIPGVNCDGE